MDNHGLYWNGRDLRTLNKMYESGSKISVIAVTLGRTETACMIKINAIRTGWLANYGADDATLKSSKA